MEITFTKYHGAGNDFIIVDCRSQKFDFKNHNNIKNLCDRRFGIGADGLMILENDESFDFKMLYFNSDGHEGTMCGNGGRCITYYAFSLGIINKKTTFKATDGIHEAFIKDDIVYLKMNDVTEIKEFSDGILIDTGSPHFVKLCDNPHSIDVNSIGRNIRNDERFSPKGVNVNFINNVQNNIQISTFERGVEAETLSCGTGSVASAIVSAIGKDNGNYTFIINAKGGTLGVSFEKQNKEYRNIWLSGPAVKVFEGKIDI